MTKHYFKTECPRCGKVDEICCEGHDAPPAIKCGACLINDVEIVALKLTPLRRELARNELAMTGVYVRGIKPPLSDFERDEIDSKYAGDAGRPAQPQVPRAEPTERIARRCRPRPPQPHFLTSFEAFALQRAISALA